MKRVLDLLLKDYHRKSQGFHILGFFFVHHRKNPSIMPLIIRSKDGLLCFNVPLLLRMALIGQKAFLTAVTDPIHYSVGQERTHWWYFKCIKG